MSQPSLDVLMDQLLVAVHGRALQEADPEYLRDHDKRKAVIDEAVFMWGVRNKREELTDSNGEAITPIRAYAYSHIETTYTAPINRRYASMTLTPMFGAGVLGLGLSAATGLGVGQTIGMTALYTLVGGIIAPLSVRKQQKRLNQERAHYINELEKMNISGVSRTKLQWNYTEAFDTHVDWTVLQELNPYSQESDRIRENVVYHQEMNNPNRVRQIQLEARHPVRQFELSEIWGDQ